MINLLLLKKFTKTFSRKNLYLFLDDEIDKIVSENNNILNIGSGGEIQDKISTLNVNNTLTSIDVDEKRSPDIVMDAMDLKFESNQFDYIFMMEVLEHIKEPHRAISEVFRVLKNDGILILSTPFIFPIHDQPYDFFRFTRFGLEYLFRDFQNIIINERNNYLESVGVLLWRLFFTKSKKLKIIGLIFLPLIFLFQIMAILLSKIDNSVNATTGYFCVVKK